MSNNSPYFKIRIIKHTPLLFGNKHMDMFHKDLVGAVKLVKDTPHKGSFFECKTGESILKSDCKKIKS